MLDPALTFVEPGHDAARHPAIEEVR